MRYISRIALCGVLLLSVFIQTGCRHDDTPYEGQPLQKHTFFIYMAANNNLGSTIDANNLNQLLQAFSERYYGPECRILVYRAPLASGGQSIPTLVEIKGGIFSGSSWSARLDTLKIYQPQSAVDPQTLRMAIEDMKSFAPADVYGLDLWSHATGWMPATATDYQKMSALFGVSQMPATRTFGQEGLTSGSPQMELADLAGAIPDHGFDYIIFDACLMGQVEVAYALRNKATYLIASPSEVLAEGLPYSKIVKHVFAVPTQLEGICREFYEHYNAMSENTRFATTALYDLRQMESLAGVMSRIVNSSRNEIPNINVSGIQRFDRYTKPTMFDLADFVDNLTAVDDGLRNELQQQLARTILYKVHTANYWKVGSKEYPVNTFCGTSTYIPLASYTDLNASYANTEWYKRVYQN